VHGASQPKSLLARSGAPTEWHRLRQLHLAKDLCAALRDAQPDVVVPCDDLAARMLADCHIQPEFADLIERSLGDPAGYPVARAKSALVALAAELRVAVPRTIPVPDRAAFLGVLADGAFPLVLKADGTSGGSGVAIIDRIDQADGAWNKITRRRTRRSAGQQALAERSLRPFVERRRWRPTVPDVQDFVAGAPANRAVVCDRGRVLAGISVEVLQTIYPSGPASVVRIIDHPEMERAAETLTADLGLSGFLGFDFVLDADGCAFLLEMNARVTPICHLAPHAGASHGAGLADALFALMTGAPSSTPDLPATGEVIALFPGEWTRDPRSPWLHDARHDVPWDDPPLMTAYIHAIDAAGSFDRFKHRAATVLRRRR
jgi:predicted ATP-grasp superfamily ATP-dependent carboligase